MVELGRWLLSEIPLIALTAICTHLVVSSGQTVFHYGLVITGSAASSTETTSGFIIPAMPRAIWCPPSIAAMQGNNTPYFLIPAVIVAGAMFLVLPFNLFVVVTAASTASFGAHVLLDKQYHAERTRLARFAWFRRKQQLHFVHHVHANCNFAVIDFFWDKVLGTYRSPDTNVR